MLARIVENWLTSAGELGYQAPFAQLLGAEGHRVLHAPVHHPFEHGKDIASLAPDGTLQVYQLKGGDIGLSDLEKIQGQLFALTATAVTYPGIEPPRRPDRAFLVTNGRLSPPARDRIRSWNDANRVVGLPPVETIERDQLVTRFVAAHGTYLPTEPAQFSQFLSFVLADGKGMFPVREYSEFLTALIAQAGEHPSGLSLKRALSSAMILTAYATGSWQRAENHVGAAEGWLVMALTILRHSELFDLKDDDWRLSFELARDSARAALRQLLDEASGSEDLVIPHLADGLVYPARAAVVCGYCAAYYLAERELGGVDDIAPSVIQLLHRELPYAKATGEAGIPSMIVAATALETLGDSVQAGRIAYVYAQALATANQPGSKNTIADPYHSLTEVLLHSLGEDNGIDDEQFAGDVYTLHVLIEWLARRDLRPLLETFWRDVTRIHFCEFRPSKPDRLLTHDDPDGELLTWATPMPTSWGELRKNASSLLESALPKRLWQEPYLIPFVPLLYPYRMISAIAKAIDYVASGRCVVEFEDDLLTDGS